jgi:heme-degrading monooxygenase HmoA
MAAFSLVLLLGYASASAYADEVMRIVRFTSGSLQQQQQAMTLVDTEINKLYRTAKGFKSVKYFMNTKTLEMGSVSLWDSQASLEAFLKSDGYKPIAGKLKPLMVGDMSSVIYSVHEPK